MRVILVGEMSTALYLKLFIQRITVFRLLTLSTRFDRVKTKVRQLL